MAEWKDVTETYTKEERQFDDSYLEQDETYEDMIEVSLFSTSDRGYEISFSFGDFYGVVYAMASRAHGIRDDMKRDLEEAYQQMKKPTPEFRDWFTDRYKVCLPSDLFFSPGYTSL